MSISAASINGNIPPDFRIIRDELCPQLVTLQYASRWSIIASSDGKLSAVSLLSRSILSRLLAPIPYWANHTQKTAEDVLSRSLDFITQTKDWPSWILSHKEGDFERYTIAKYIRRETLVASCEITASSSQFAKSIVIQSIANALIGICSQELKTMQNTGRDELDIMDFNRWTNLLNSNLNKLRES